MNETKNVGLVMLGLLLATGCGSSGSPGAPAGPPPPGSTNVIDVVADTSGNPVTASFASPVAVNDANQVIGFAAVEAGAPFVAALWTVDASGAPAGAPRRLSALAGNSFSAAFAIDAGGNAYGQSEKGSLRVAVRWPAGSSEPVELPALAASGNSAAFGATADGTLVVGEAQNATGATRAVVWTADGQGGFGAPLSLPVTAFAVSGTQPRFAAANGVARVGAAIWVVGEVEDADGVERAALWRSSSGTAYSTTALHKGEVRTVAHAVSGSGLVVGEAEESSGVTVPSVWKLEDTGTELKRSSLGSSGAAVAVDSANRAAGWLGASPVATVWSLPAGEAVSPVPGDGASQAHGINANGLVVGYQGKRGFVSKLP